MEQLQKYKSVVEKLEGKIQNVIGENSRVNQKMGQLEDSLKEERSRRELAEEKYE